jgi:hypothetical protein
MQLRRETRAQAQLEKAQNAKTRDIIGLNKQRKSKNNPKTDLP